MRAENRGPKDGSVSASRNKFTNAGYQARITKDKKYIHLGCFATAEEAHAAYVKAARELFGEWSAVA
jgi:hypothetical protein